MKLRNKETGKIGRLQICGDSYMITEDSDANRLIAEYLSIRSLNEEWEDAPEEPNEYYCIDWTERDGIYKTRFEDARDAFNQEIGNYFETKEEAEQAVEKLKAWKRLKDRGFRFLKYSALGFGEIDFAIDADWEDEEFDKEQHEKDLDLLFGGEE